LTYSTPFPDLIDALRSLRVPAILVSIISFMYRYLAVIGEEAGRMTRARASRSAGGIDPPPSARTGGTIRWRARVTGGMVGALFIRSYERSERVHAAMLARGFDGSLARPSLAPPPPGQVAAFGVLLALVVLFTVLVMAWGPGP
jgi:cobalt/nickel transport system permease protein